MLRTQLCSKSSRPLLSDEMMHLAPFLKHGQTALTYCDRWANGIASKRRFFWVWLGEPSCSPQAMRPKNCIVVDCLSIGDWVSADSISTLLIVGGTASQ